MCNAHNHSPSCVCGFGGDGHRGGGSGRSNVALNWLNNSPYCIHEDGFCRPTTCPKCKASVYFIRHNGGSLWVDELGKPWDKHPCFADEISENSIKLYQCIKKLTDTESQSILCRVFNGSVNSTSGNLEIAVNTQDDNVMTLELSRNISVNSIGNEKPYKHRSTIDLLLEGGRSPADIKRFEKEQSDDLHRRIFEWDTGLRFHKEFIQSNLAGWERMKGQAVSFNQADMTFNWVTTMEILDKRFNPEKPHSFDVIISFPVISFEEVG